jgi:hypothetical protein
MPLDRPIAAAVGLAASLLIAGAPTASQSPAPTGEATIAEDRAVAPSGRRWEMTELGEDTSIRSVTAWRGGFAALGSRGPKCPRRGDRMTVWLSRDGSDWTAMHEPFGPCHRDIRVDHIVGLSGGLVALGSDGMRLAVWRSRGGRIWQRVRGQVAFERPDPVPTSEYFLWVDHVVERDGRLVASGGYVPGGGDREHFDRVWTTEDGLRWTGRRLRGGMATATDEEGFIGLVSLRHWPRGVDCDVGVLYEVARSPDGQRWERTDAGRLPCGNQVGVVHHGPSDAYLAVRQEGRLPAIVVSQDMRSWSHVPLDPGMFGGPELTWDPDAIEAGDGVVVIAGADPDNHLWALITEGGRTWELSAGWPEMRDVAGLVGVAIGHGRIGVATDWPSGRLWATDARAGGAASE